MRRTAWGSALDLKRAATNVRAEMGPSDWHLDPWGWPELDYLDTKEPDLLLQNRNGVRGRWSTHRSTCRRRTGGRAQPSFSTSPTG